MSISATTLKRLCRHYGIKRWPFRQISGIDRTVHRLEAELQASLQRSPNGTMVNPIAAHIRELHAHRQGMVEVGNQPFVFLHEYETTYYINIVMFNTYQYCFVVLLSIILLLLV